MPVETTAGASAAKVGQDGEWPLFLDVWPEHSTEDVAVEHREGNEGSPPQ